MFLDWIDIRLMIPIFGALGGWFGGFASRLVSDYRDRKNLNKFLLAGIQNDLKISISIFEKIQEETEKNSIIWDSLFKQLKFSRMFFADPNINRNLLLLKTRWRDDIQNYYFESEYIVSTLEVLQTRKTELQNLKAQTIRSLKEKKEKISEEELNSQVQRILENELRELEWLTFNFTHISTKLSNLITKAQSLYDLLKV